VALAAQVFGQVDVAGAIVVHTAITQTNLDFTRDGDDELAPRRRVPVDVAALAPTSFHDVYGCFR